MTPRISTSAFAEHPQFLRARVELVDPTIEIAHYTVLSFHLRVEENSFLKVDPAARAATPRADRVMIIFDPKTG